MRWPAARVIEQAGKGLGMHDQARELERSGTPIIHLEFGRPSSDTPDHIKEAAKAALDAGLVHYSDPQGLPDLRHALAKRYRELNCMAVDADHILITNGVTHGSFVAIMAGVNPGDEVIVLDPFYPQHHSKIRLAGGRVISVPLDASNDFRLNPDAIAAAITPATRMIVLVNPSNPTGVMYTRAELLALAAVCQERDLVVLADEVYELNTYDDLCHISIASLPGMANRTITVSAFTKAYAMDGWRMGFVVAPPPMIRDMMKISLNDITHPCVFAQAGAIAAVTGPQKPLLKMVAEDRRRRDLTVNRLNAMRGVTCHVPQAAIYAFPDVSAVGVPSGPLARNILVTTHVAVEDGTFYGRQGENHLRICFGAQPYQRLEEALDRLDSYFRSVSKS